jgi:hypothetical protein
MLLPRRTTESRSQNKQKPNKQKMNKKNTVPEQLLNGAGDTLTFAITRATSNPSRKSPPKSLLNAFPKRERLDVPIIEIKALDHARDLQNRIIQYYDAGTSIVRILFDLCYVNNDGDLITLKSCPFHRDVEGGACAFASFKYPEEQVLHNFHDARYYHLCHHVLLDGKESCQTCNLEDWALRFLKDDAENLKRQIPENLKKYGLLYTNRTKSVLLNESVVPTTSTAGRTGEKRAVPAAAAVASSTTLPSVNDDTMSTATQSEADDTGHKGHLQMVLDETLKHYVGGKAREMVEGEEARAAALRAVPSSTAGAGNMVSSDSVSGRTTSAAVPSQTTQASAAEAGELLSSAFEGMSVSRSSPSSVPPNNFAIKKSLQKAVAENDFSRIVTALRSLLLRDIPDVAMTAEVCNCLFVMLNNWDSKGQLPEAQTQFTNDDHACGVLCDILRRFHSDPVVIASIAASIGLLAYQNTPIAEQLAEYGVCEALVDALRKFGNSDFFLCSVWYALGSLITGGRPGLEMLNHYRNIGVCSAVVASYRSMGNGSFAATATLRFFFLLAKLGELKDNLPQLEEAGAGELLIPALIKFGGAQIVAYAICGAIERLCLDPGIKASVLANPSAVQAVQCCSAQLETKHNALTRLTSLCTGEDLEQETTEQEEVLRFFWKDILEYKGSDPDEDPDSDEGRGGPVMEEEEELWIDSIVHGMMQKRLLVYIGVPIMKKLGCTVSAGEAMIVQLSDPVLFSALATLHPIIHAGIRAYKGQPELPGPFFKADPFDDEMLHMRIDQYEKNSVLTVCLASDR